MASPGALCQVVARGEAATEEVGRRLARFLGAGDVLSLQGGLGAGKTTLVRGLAAGLGVDKAKVASPTFALLHPYRGGRLVLYHIDVFRLEDPGELWELGAGEALAGGGVTVIEWGERAGDLLPPEHLQVELVPLPEPDARLIRLVPRGKRYGQVCEALGEELRRRGWQVQARPTSARPRP